MIQFLGFLLFVCIAMVGFWLLFFLFGFLPYWIVMGSLERFGLINSDKEKE